jgi:HPt (histidine-containing phosphotransfer) domain-containing protein/HAMP domain-containing protein
MDARHDAPAPRAPQSLRAKLIRTMIGTLSVVCMAVLVMVAVLHIWTVRDTLALVEAKIRESIIRKGQGLVSNHAQALRGLVADNAFSDVRRLVEGTLREDPELVYGLFLGSDGQPWAYASPSTPHRPPPGSTRTGRLRPEAAWTELNIDPAVATGRGLRSVRRTIFGQDVFEFSAPVVSEDGNVVGAVIYAVSGAPLERALAKARGDSRRSLVTAISLLGILAMGTMAFGMALARQAASRITKPLAELTRATAAIAAGDRQLRVAIRSQDELEALGDAFNQMVAELNESYARLEGLNHTLEQRVDERTRELASRNRELRLVLDTVNEGLLGLTPDGRLAPEHSAIIDRWFGPYPSRARFGDYMMAFDRAFAETFELGYEALLEGVLPRELCLAQLPARLRHGQREYKVAYLPIGEGGRDSGLLIVVTDVTEQLQLAQQDAEQRELLAVFQGFTRDRAGFLAFFDEASDLLEQVASGAHDVTTQKRLVHTLKGNAQLASLNVVAQLCHRAEDELDENHTVQVTATIVELRSRWLTLTQNLRALVGDRGRDVVELQTRDLEHLCDELARGGAPPRTIQRLSALRFEPVERPLERLAGHARALTQRLGKGDVIIDIEALGLRLDPRRWSPLWSELVHVVRNAVDHGFESAEERRAAGKPPRPRLRLGAYLRENEFAIELEDDGRGIDWVAVREAAAARGITARTESELVGVLFSGLTTRAEVSSTSGRGVGLSAVYARVQEFQGQVVVLSQPGAGTCMRFSFPLSTLGPLEGSEALREERALSGTAVA